ncbi:MAG: polysaccharide export protein [Proteobacteria bacterium]|nr:polysaccharide export protein [Pseudomonadota bacterium]MBU1736873.1 polysaccharide export protein [Pseudomonadota bacterium]
MQQGFLRSIIMLIGVVLIASGNPALAQPETNVVTADDTAGETMYQPGDYLIGAGDLLKIMVWKNEEISRSLPVLPDGTVSVPLIGKMTAAGKKVDQIEEEIRKRLGVYINAPVLSVSVEKVNSLLIYVIGRVNAPGMFILNNNINILQALAMARGLTPFADEDDIKVMRHTAAGLQILEFDYGEVVKGENLEQNVMLTRGDTIVVP